MLGEAPSSDITLHSYHGYSYTLASCVHLYVTQRVRPRPASTVYFVLLLLPGPVVTIGAR